MEQRLNEMMETVYREVARLDAEAVVRAAEDLRRAAFWEVISCLIAQRDAEDKALKVMASDAAAFEATGPLRKYIAEVETRWRAAEMETEEATRFSFWLRWAKQKLEEVDPLMSSARPWNRPEFLAVAKPAGVAYCG